LTLHTLQLLKDAKAQIDVPDCEGRTTLHHAIRAHNMSAVEYMLKNYTPFDTSSWNVECDPPLHKAVVHSSTSMVEILLKHNFGAVELNREGKSPLAVATESGSDRAEPIVLTTVRAADKRNAIFELPASERAAAEPFLESLKEKEANAKQAAAADAKASVKKQQMRFGSGRLGDFATACEGGHIRYLACSILKGAK